MDRKDFIKNSLIATGAILLPNAIWAFDKNFTDATKSLNKFISLPNLKRFKVAERGTKFFETELRIIKAQSSSNLIRKYFVSENTEGICTPTLLETSKKESFVFIPELYKGKKNNGFIVKVCENGFCEETKIFTHENQGYFAFWGKEYLGHPTLYHYNLETLHLMRMHWEDEQWINHRVMPMYPNDMMALYKQQLQQVTQGQLTQQFGFDFEIHKDSFYQFLALKHGWEQGLITKEKEGYEIANPARIYINTDEVPNKISDTITGFTNPFIPIYCKGDDQSYAIIKPTILYAEVPNSKIEISDMPAYKTQDELGECRAFSLAVLLQHYICQKWKSDIPDCKNPPADSAISYFGMLAYTNQIREEESTFRPNQQDARNMHDIINDLSKSGNRLILDSCKSFDNFNLNSEKKRDQFFEYLKELYNSQKNMTEANIVNCTDCIAEINKTSGLNVDLKNLKIALTKDTFDKFLYSLFFNGCKMENFPSGFSAAPFPLDSMNVSPLDVKGQIIKGLKQGRLILFSALCISQNLGEECKEGHSLVISGYKKVCEAESPTKYKDIFKLHNSWGAEWQKTNNYGWVDADVFVSNTIKPNLVQEGIELLQGV